MTNKINTFIALLVCALLQVIGTRGQEHTGPLLFNGQLAGHSHYNANASARRTALSLPFFEDFTGDSFYTDASRWVESQVYVNNTMCVSPISRGVATFDALDTHGYPWDSFSNGHFRYCDSLTALPIDISGNTPADSLYLSFFYQPQGYGFFPLTGDSLILYMKVRYGDWVPIWKAQGVPLQPFQQVMIPITDSLYFHSTFQFRFVNIAALNFSDAIWNVDYIRLDAHRNMYDTAVNDAAFTSEPSFYLNDYTSMPYRQFYANITGERSAHFFDSVRNDNLTPVSVRHGYYANDVGSGTVLQSPTMSAGASAISGASSIQVIDSVFGTTVPLGSSVYQPVEFINKFYIQAGTGTGPIANDTITRRQIFDNYLAYDDGSAEQAYYLTLYPTLPGEISIEHHLNIPDTMRGLSIYFARQAPLPAFKTFYIRVYSQLAGVNGAASSIMLYEQKDCTPGYADTVNHFWVYKFDTAVPLPAGTFYAGIFLLAESGDDSLYIGLDMNRLGGNHAYYNVLSTWNPSLVQGALMMRPVLGQNITASSVRSVNNAAADWKIMPNPATDHFSFDFPGDDLANYSVTDIQGRIIMSGTATAGTSIDISNLFTGIYFVNISCNGLSAVPQKLIKL